jgi:hypothetical protein
MRYCAYRGGEVSESAKACGHYGRWLDAEASVPPGPEPAVLGLRSGAET